MGTGRSPLAGRRVLWQRFNRDQPQPGGLLCSDQRFRTSRAARGEYQCEDKRRDGADDRKNPNGLPVPRSSSTHRAPQSAVKYTPPAREMLHPCSCVSSNNRRRDVASELALCGASPRRASAAAPVICAQASLTFSCGQQRRTRCPAVSTPTRFRSAIPAVVTLVDENIASGANEDVRGLIERAGAVARRWCTNPVPGRPKGRDSVVPWAQSSQGTSPPRNPVRFRDHPTYRPSTASRTGPPTIARWSDEAMSPCILRTPTKVN